MNQEQDNINNYNIQNNTFNNTTTTTNTGQSIASVDLLKSGSSNNLNLNNKPKKKKSFGLIIGIVVIVIVIGVILLFNIINNDNNNGTSNSDSSSGNKSEHISQIYVKFDRVIALTDDGTLYVVQNQTIDDYYGEGFPSVIKSPKVIAKNVKKFFDDGTAYIDIENNLYRGGLNPIKSGMYDKYVKLGSNIKDIDNAGLGLLAVSNDGQLYVFGNSQFYMGAGKDDSSLTKLDVGDNYVVDVAMLSYTWTVYLTDKGELYARKYGNEKFVKVDDDISKIEEVHLYNTNNKYIQKTDGKNYKVDDYADDFTLNEVNVTKAESFPTDVKTMIYDRYNYLSGGGKKSSDGYVYINNSNKIVLYDVTSETLGYDNGFPVLDTKVTKKELDNSIKSMNQILEFVDNYSY